MKKIYPVVIGLGYVGLPIFLNLQESFKTVGFDINKKRINNLKKKYVLVIILLILESIL